MSLKKYIYPAIIFILGIVLYGSTLKGVAGNPTPEKIIDEYTENGMPFESSQARGRFAQTMAIVEDGTFDLKNGKEIIALPDVGHYGIKFYSLFPPGISILSVPAYMFGKTFGYSQIAVSGLLAIIGILNGLLIYAILKKMKIPGWAAAFSSIAFIFGTTSWPYAVSISQHKTTVQFLLIIIN